MPRPDRKPCGHFFYTYPEPTAETVSRRAIGRGWDGLLRLGASVKHGWYPATEALDRSSRRCRSPAVNAVVAVEPGARPASCRSSLATFQGFTAHYLATDVGHLGPGRSCLVHAAAGGVGQLLVGFAARLGATVYGTVRAEDQKRIARERGAQDVFLSDKGGFVAPLLELTGGAGVDVVFDSVGKPTLRDDFKVMRKKGLVVNFGASGGAVDDLNPAELDKAGSLYLTRPRLQDHLPNADTIQARAAALYAGLADGTLSLSLGRRYAMEQIGLAHADLEAGKAGGKPVLDIASQGIT